ncbi:MAG: RND family transporter [Thermoplasmata archaeon]|nr:RND family transporter [Thermoplasmata archaeon]
MLARVKKIIETRHKPVLFIIITITLIFSMFLPSVEFRTNIEEFYPENDAVKADHRIENNFGKDPSLQYIYVTPRGSDPNSTVLSLAALQEEYNITQRLREIPGVVGTVSVAEYLHNFLSLNNISSFLETNWSSLKDYLFNLSSDTSAEQFFFLQQMLISNDSNIFTPLLEGKAPRANATLIIVQLNSSLSTEDRKNLANEVRETIHNMPLEKIETEVTGADIMAYQVDEVSNATIVYMGAGIIILITLILYLSFRRLSYVFLPLLTVVIAAIWTLGTMVILGLEFTALHVAFLPLLIGLGIDDAVHVSRRYQEELRKGRHPTLSMAITMKSIGTAIFLTSLTTIIAFLSNGLSGVKPVKDFGIVCAIGIAYAFILTVTFYVGMRYWLDRRGGERIILGMKIEAPRMDTLVSKAAFTIDSHPKTVVLFVVAITLLSIFGATRVRTEFDVKEFLPEDLPSMEAANSIEENFIGGSYTTAYVMYEGNDLDTVHSLDVMYRTTENIKNDEYLVKINVWISSGTGLVKPAYQITTPLTVIGMALDNDESLANRFNFTCLESRELRDKWLPNQAANDDDVRGFYDYLYTSTTKVDPISGKTYGDLMRSVVHRNENGEYDAVLIKLWVNAKTSEASRTVYNELKDDVCPMQGSKAYITGTVILLIQTVDSIQASQIQSTTLAILLAAVILCLIYRDIELGLISILPVALNVTWILGIMALISYIHEHLWSGAPAMSLNVLTVTVTSLSIGLGIDYSIHVVQRFRENLFQEHESVQDAIHSTLEHTGSALFISAATTVIGFGVLIFAPMPLIQMFGIITAASIAFSLLSTTILLPILLVAWANFHGHFKFKKERLKR